MGRVNNIVGGVLVRVRFVSRTFSFCMHVLGFGEGEGSGRGLNKHRKPWSENLFTCLLIRSIPVLMDARDRLPGSFH